MNEKWPLVVEILPDEVFSSWLVRLAINHSCDPIDLTGYIWPGWRLWMTDIDRKVDNQKLSLLNQFTGLGSKTIGQTFLINTAKKIGDIKTHGVWDWITTIGSRNRKRLSGLSCCTQCLSDDLIPYFRKSWRYAWHTCCEIHMIRLMNSCQFCNAPIMPHLVTAKFKSLRYCTNCLEDLSNCSVNNVSSNEISRQVKIDHYLAERKGFVGGSEIDIRQWCVIFKLLINLFSRRFNKNFKSLHALKSELSKGYTLKKDKKYGVPFESMQPAQRAILMDQVWPIMKIDIEQIIKTFQKFNISINCLKELSVNLPKVFDVLGRNNYKNHSSTIQKTDHFHQSKEQVLRSYKRLIRRNKFKILGISGDKQ